MTCGVSVWRVAQFEPGQRAEQIKMAMSKQLTSNLDGFEVLKKGRNTVIAYEDMKGVSKLSILTPRQYKYVMPEKLGQDTHPNPQVRRADFIAHGVECVASYQRWRWSKNWLDCSGDWLIGDRQSCTHKYDSKDLQDFWLIAYWDVSGYVMWRDYPVFFVANTKTYIPLISKAALESEILEFNTSEESRTLYMCRMINSQLMRLGDPEEWATGLVTVEVKSLKDMPNKDLYPAGALKEVLKPVSP